MLAAFIDTNALLHYPPLADVDWCSVCGADAVTLVLCLPVIKELDKYKSDERLGARAQSRIREISKASGTEVRPGVVVKTYNVPLRRGDFPDTLSIDEPDDKIVHFAKLYRDKEKGDVAVISEDFGMRLRCEAHGIPTFQPPAHQRLASPQSEEVRKLRQLQQELNALRNKLPALQLKLDPGPDHVHDLERPKLRPVSDSLAEFKQSKRGYFSNDQAAELFRAAENRLLNNYMIQDESARTIALRASLSNVGHAPANGITVTMTFPEIIGAVVYGLWLDGERVRHEVGYKLNREIPEAVEPTPALFARDLRPLFGHVSNRVFTFEYPQLAHDATFSFEQFFLTFRSWEDVRPIEVVVSIRTLDPPDMQRFTIPVCARILRSPS